MAQTQRRFVDPVEVMLPPTPAARAIARADDFALSDSPVGALQERLLASFGSVPARDEDKLPLQVRMKILIGSSLALWAAIGTVALTALK